jgi:multiple sugar transport system permease protein
MMGRTARNVRVLKETIAGYVFVGPLVIGLFMFTLIPILSSILLSFTDWNFIKGFSQLNFIGLKNFRLLFDDAVFVKSLINNFILILIVPASMGVSLLLAVIINKHVYFKNVFKVIYFMPYISSVVAVAIVFQVIFHPSYGPVNQTLYALGIEHPPQWLADIHFALVSVMAVMVWIHIGYNLLIYIAGLQSIPKDLYDSAEIDGAKSWQKFWGITIPMLAPTTFFLMVTGIIGSFKVFDIIQVLTGGGPASATSVMVQYLYEQAFVNLKSGYASSVSVVLLCCVFTITAIQFYGQKKWTNE